MVKDGGRFREEDGALRVVFPRFECEGVALFFFSESILTTGGRL
jgi:hypothetical protein